MSKNQLRRNPFWQIIEKEVPKLGYYRFYPEATKGDSMLLIIEGMRNGETYNVKYHFPRRCRSLESTQNFKSALRNYIKRELPSLGVYPPNDHRVRKPGMYVAHINHDAPKKILIPPKKMLEEMKHFTPEPYKDIPVAPVIPETYVGEKKKIDEPVSDHMVLATFLVDAKDLSTLIEVSEGTAKFKVSRPAPLRILPKEQQQVEVVKIQEVAPPKKIRLVSSNNEPIRKKSFQESVLEIMSSNPNKEWSVAEFFDLNPKRSSVYAMLSMMVSSKKIVRTQKGVFKLAA